MLRTDYIKAFTKAIEEADLKNKNVVRNLKNALVMVSARYNKKGFCTNIESVACYAQGYNPATLPAWNFHRRNYRLKPEPQYKQFDYDSVKPYLNRCLRLKNSDAIWKIKGVAICEVILSRGSIEEVSIFVSYKDLLHEGRFIEDNKPCGVEYV
jgi:hypothetical protein